MAVTGSPRSGEEIQAALQTFVTRWKNYAGTERSEAQTFLNDLFECHGTSRIEVGAKFEGFQASASGSGFMDLHWPEVVIIEMKRPSRSIVQSAQDQVMRYWRESAVETLDQPAAVRDRVLVPAVRDLGAGAFSHATPSHLRDRGVA